MNLNKSLWIMAVLVGALVSVPLGALATSYTWDAGGSNDNWTTSGNWDLSGNPNAFDAQATIDTANGTPVLLTSKRRLGGGANSLTIGASAAVNALNLNKGGTLQLRGNISNAQTITINSGGNLQAYPANHGSGIYNLTGDGNISLLGGTISTKSGTTGTWNFQEAVSGYGVISAPVINNSTISASGGTSSVPRTLTMSNASFTNNGTITIQMYNTLNNTSSGNYNLGPGSVGLRGGTLASTAGRTYTSNNLSGYGTIAAALINRGTLTADSGGVSGKILKVTQAVSGPGDVIVGVNAADTVMLDLEANLGAKNFTLNQAASLQVSAGNTITLTGNFTNNSQTEGNWLSGQGFNLTLSGSTFEVAGYDNGPTSGFSNNFNLNTLTVIGNLQLEDLVDNGNRTGIHGAQEALYVNSLTGSGTLDLHGLWCYVNNGGAPFALGNGLYHGLTISGAAAPIPGSVWLMGSGLVVLGLLRFRRRERNI